MQTVFVISLKNKKNNLHNNNKFVNYLMYLISIIITLQIKYLLKI